MNYEKALELAKSDLIYKCTECTRANSILSQCRRKCNLTFRKYVSFAFANIPRELWDLEIDDFNVSAKDPEDKEKRIAALKTVRFYMDNLANAYRKGLGMVLYGFHGTGKSMLAACILKEAIRLDKKVKMIEFNDITSIIRKSRQEPDEMTELENQIETLDVICIENFGVNQFLRSPDEISKDKDADKEKELARFVRGPDYMTREISRLLNNRRRAMLPNILTTYYNIEALMKSQDDEGRQLMSTITGHCEQIYIAGEDYRKDVLSKNWENRVAKR